MVRAALLLPVFLTALGGCSRPVTPPASESDEPEAAAPRDGTAFPRTAVRFADVASERGITFTYRNGKEADHYTMPESLGGGAALFDYDRDGKPDLFFPGGGRFGADKTIEGLSPALYRHEGSQRFREVTEPAGVPAAPYYSHGVAAGDYDNDGFRDFLVTGYGGLLLYHNQGDGTFAERSGPAGLHDSSWSTSAAWADIDGDGDLDLYVAHYVDWSFENHPYCSGPRPGQREICPPRKFGSLPDVLYLNEGDRTFRDVSAERGLRVSGENMGKGLGVLAGDVDLDGDVDIYVANDNVPNFLYRNDGNGHLTEVATVSGTALSAEGLSDGSMGVALGDYNLDGLPDLWVANFEHESFALYRNEGDCFFQHVSAATGVTAVGGLYVGWGTVFFDADRDGDEDLFAANGHVVRHPSNAPVRQKPLLFENRNGRRFVNVAPQTGGYMTAPHMGRGVAEGDIDGDGDLDLAVSHTNEPAALLSNESKSEHHWLSLRLIGRQSNRDAVGAVVRVQTGDGEQVRQLTGGASYASSSDPRLFFGLGKSSRVKKVTVRWPSGTVQNMRDIAANRVLRVHEPAAPSPVAQQ